MTLLVNDTIVAIATPIGEGAISVIRISGPETIAVADRVFRGSAPLKDSDGYRVHFGHIIDSAGEPIDEVLATVFRQPHSFTGEESVELSCHGGLLVTQMVLEAILQVGARHAGPGEFTRRAFLNGKMDLSRAEAVADLIAATSRKAHRASLGQLEGKLGGRVAELKAALTDLCGVLEIDLDFSEEGIDLIQRDEINARIGRVDVDLREMIDSFESGHIYREGVSVALVGKPNAGKSSLFNALLQENRAIVTAVPGTTRDSLEESISLEGILFRLSDTAGLRDSVDVAEVEGVKRSRDIIGRADVLVLVVDALETIDAGLAYREFTEEHAVETNQHVLIVLNKCDLLPLKGKEEGRSSNADRSFSVDPVSAKTGEGLGRFKKRLVNIIAREGTDQSLFLTNRRHRDACARARESLASARASLALGTAYEFIAFDLREAGGALAEITGEVTSEEILNNIFKNFCIGK